MKGFRVCITVADPGFPVGGMHPLGGHGPPTWAVKMYVKMKELGPIGGGVRPARPLDPPMHYTILLLMKIKMTPHDHTCTKQL